MITAAPVLATLAQVIADGKVDVAGAVDQTQIEEVRDQWGPTGVSSWKLPLLRQAIESGRFAGKRSTPWGPGTLHDYMHAKVTVADDAVFLGSFNLSHSGSRTRRTSWRSTTRPWRSAWRGSSTGCGPAIRSRPWRNSGPAPPAPPRC